ncbi:MAG: NAD-dependent protein deacylase [Clostridiales bacterium]|jgi:NAD-dependent deacetylase|nr:NAD-dependent protein deacylase [Clostridiales bacterium]
MNDKILKLKELIELGGLVFFGGAGVSTESNIPDFRSEAGLYATKELYGHPPEYLLSIDCFVRNTDLFFKYYKENMIYRDAAPNDAHKALAQLEARGLLSWIITQNVDGLHQAAGSKNVAELHGANDCQYCVVCRRKFDLEYTLNPENCEGLIPKCACGGIVRPDVVLYGEPLNQKVISLAVNAISTAKCLIVGGTSLAVYPAAGLINYLPQGSPLVLINKSETPFDGDANLIIRESIGAVLKAATS